VLAARPALQARLVARWPALAAGGALAFIALAIAGGPLFERLGDQLQTGPEPAAMLWRGAKAAIGGVLVLGIVGFTLGRERGRAPGRVVAYGQRPPSLRTCCIRRWPWRSATGSCCYRSPRRFSG
jgi:hypothetical protein